MDGLLKKNRSWGAGQCKFRRVVLKFILFGFFIALLCWKVLFPHQSKVNGDYKGSMSKRVDTPDPDLLSLIKNRHLQPPPSKPYSVPNPSLIQVSKEILDALRVAGYDDKSPGVFIEAGANDGVLLSNTLYLELNRNWTGLLVEASPSTFKKLEDTKRNAWISNVCLSVQQERLEFLRHLIPGHGTIDWEGKYAAPKKFNPKEKESHTKMEYDSEGFVNCFPLYSLLKALDMTKIDLFSLDVEGHEFKVLQGIPFDKVDIKVIFIEHAWLPEGKDFLRKFFEDMGYNLYREDVHNFLFIKEAI